MNFWEKLKKFRIKDADFQNVPPQTAYTMIVLGMIHFMVMYFNRTLKFYIFS